MPTPGAMAQQASLPVVDELDLRVALRHVAAALAATAGLWHGVRALGLPAGTAGAILATVSLAVAQLALAAWMLWRPSRTCALVGAAGTATTTAAAVLLLWATGRSLGLPEALGIVLQVALLMVLLVAAAGTPSPRVLNAAVRGGAATVAVMMSVMVAGPHDHARASAPRGAPAASFLCHLI